MASTGGVEPLDFTQHKDVAKGLSELVPGGLDVAIDCGIHCGSSEFQEFDPESQTHSTSRRRFAQG